jgi:AcrR family transcriptional regulator
VQVSRWAPDARERLEAAALDLFVENGYEETTVAQIADRAGLNRATFFRYFTDKREVLFGGEDVLAGLLAEGIRAAFPGCDAHRVPAGGVRGHRGRDDPAAAG